MHCDVISSLVVCRAVCRSVGGLSSIAVPAFFSCRRPKLVCGITPAVVLNILLSPDSSLRSVICNLHSRDIYVTVQLVLFQNLETGEHSQKTKETSVTSSEQNWSLSVY